jgi:hypothetical protein
MELQATVEGEDSGSEYSDTNDRQARKAERKAMLRKRKQKRKMTKEGSPKTVRKKSKVARLRELTTLENSDGKSTQGKMFRRLQIPIVVHRRDESCPR